MQFEITILGSGSAVPTGKRNPTAQFVECCKRHILIDCGEGTQMQIRKAGVKFQKIEIILISHLHGDHFFGLVGLLSTMHMMGRDEGLKVFGPKGLKEIIVMQLEMGGSTLGFGIEFIELDGKTAELIYEDKLIEIHTFPLQHRIPTNGFRIQEKPKERSIIGEALREQNISLQSIPFFRKGQNYIDELGVEHDVDDYTSAPRKSKSYAFCSDTRYTETILPYIKAATVLYHEATFTEKHLDRAKKTFHSTASQAATIATLAGVSKLLLGHISARYENGDVHAEEAVAIFENTQVVEDFQKILL